MSTQKYSNQLKVRTVLEGLKSPDGIAAYCRRIGVSDVLFYQWQKQMLANADGLFSRSSQSAAKKISELESELKRKDHIIAAVTEEALELKKKLVR